MPPADQNTCPVCNWQLNTALRSVGDLNHFDCPRCGSFIFTGSALADLPSVLRTDKQRAALSYSIRRAQRDGEKPRYLYAQLERIVKSEFLPGAHEQSDNLIRWMGDTTDGVGIALHINPRDHGAIAGSLLKDEGFVFLIKEMIKSRLLEGTFGTWKYDNPKGGTTTSDGMARVTLSFEGWGRYEELRRGSASGNIAFMAMQYSDPDLDHIVDDHFRPAVDLTGFTLRRLDDDPKAGLIDDRLRVEINACRLLIADLTHGNRGAYWEAGYAEGLGKPVIYTCRDDVFNNPDYHPHFDTNHHLTVTWDPADIEDACGRLKETIRATMPDAKQED